VIPFSDVPATWTQIPFFKTWHVDFWHWPVYILFVTLVITGSSNAVNLTDGLDGLAAGLSAIAAATFAIFAYVMGRVDYVGLPEPLLPARRGRAGDLLRGAGRRVHRLPLVQRAPGRGVHGRHRLARDRRGARRGGGDAEGRVPARDHRRRLRRRGALGRGADGLLQVDTKKRTGVGRRIFRMAPLHHHFEQIGWHESKVIIRFWILGIIFAMVAFAFATLKIR
jgi:phospho-N-acetylmuramoyl-pentapeptide-transferase